MRALDPRTADNLQLWARGSVINFAALHVIYFYFHNLRISDHGPIAATEQEGACNLPLLLRCIAQSSFQCGVEIAPYLRHGLIAILTEE